MDERITIIEGPPPVFETVDDGWAVGLNEGPYLYDLAMTRLRTFNGPALVERCHRAWSSQQSIYLHYRNDMGMEETAPIMAARTLETDEGHVLLLWCRKDHAETLTELDLGDDDEDFDDPDLL